VTTDLVALGWLPDAEQGNKGAIIRALIDLYDRAIRARVTPSTGSHDQLGFMCAIQRSTIEWEPVGCATRLAFGEAPAEVEFVSRSVVRDNGQTIRQTLYHEEGNAALVELSPVRANTLATRLLDAAAPRLKNG
jgi:hypothetical protein